MFTVFNAYVLRPVSVPDPYSLYAFTWMVKSGAGHTFTLAEYQSLRQQKEVFSDVIAYRNFLGAVDGFSLFGQPVSDNYFTMLGVGIFQGRPLVPGDTAAMVIGYQAWQNKFGGDPNLVGRKVYLRGHPFEVVGITAQSFAGLESAPTGFWIPLKTFIDDPDLSGSGVSLWVIGRLRHGVRPETAQSALLAWAQSMTADAPDEGKARGAILRSRATTIPMTREVILSFVPILVAFMLILVTACANVSNMMLARALARQREIGIRVSLGAGRGRLVRQLLTESVLLAAPAAVAGFVISETTVRAARFLVLASVPPTFARIVMLADLAPDWRVFGFILAGAFAATLVFGLIPALQTTRSSLVQANRGDFSNDLRPQRLRNALIVAQVAVCALLLVTTILVVRSEQRMMAVDIGLDTRGVYDARMVGKRQPAAVERLVRLAGVEAVAVAWRAPLYGSLRQVTVVPSGSKESFNAGYNFVSPAYFAVFHIPVIRGRVFSDAEAEGGAPVAVVSESTAQRFWPGRDALGETIAIPPVRRGDPYYQRIPPFTTARVVGVARNVMNGMAANGPERTCIYFPNATRSPYNDSVLVRMAGGDSAESRRLLATALDEVAPSLADTINPIEEVLAMQAYPFRLAFWVAGFLGAFALVLTVSGIYGVMSYLVSQRKKEIGIRVALGAGSADVIGMVMHQSLRLAAIGAAAGLALMLSLAPLLSNQMEAVKPYDIAPYAAAAVLVVLATLMASYFPTRRALRIDAATTLRCD